MYCVFEDIIPDFLNMYNTYMPNIEEQIEAIQKEIRETPYHKATEHHIGMLRAKLSRLKDKQLEAASRKGGGGGGYAVKKQGDATVVLVGPPSVGKSTLLNKLTNAQSKVAPYSFTTVTVIPGMMTYKDARIQILDVPGLIEGAEEGKGRGREVLSVVRGSDLLVLITDIIKLGAVERIKEALERNGIRIDKKRPDVVIDKKMGGGITVHSNIKQDLSNDTIKQIASEYGVKNGEITIKEKLTMETLIDAFSPNRVYIPSLVVINKIDITDANNVLPTTSHRSASQKINHGLHKRLNTNHHTPILISAEKNTGLDELKNAFWDKLEFMRVYLVRQNEEPSFNNPLVVKKHTRLEEVMQTIGTEFAEGKKGAKIWGAGAKFPGQEVSLKTHTQEGMQVRFF
jgi:uncharacterized protein